MTGATSGDTPSSVVYTETPPSFCDRLLFCKRRGYKELKPHQELFVDNGVLSKSVKALKFAVLCNAMNATILKPNYAPLVISDNPDTFPNTDPFDFSAAVYFLQMTPLLAAALSSVFMGKISDKVGRKPVILVMLGMAGVGSMIKYFAQGSFWGFNGASFFTGIFSATLPIGMAYVSDVNPSKADSDREQGMIVAFYMFGIAGGGICAIILSSQGLFAPLWLGVAFMALSFVTTIIYLVEPKEYEKLYGFKEADNNDESDKGLPVPTVLNKPVFVNILLGALTDNIGSVGLTSLMLTPIMYNKWYLDFTNAGLQPIMSLMAYKWIQIGVAALVIPSTLLCPILYSKIGPAGTCVVGNLLTGLVTMALLLFTTYTPDTSASFGGFVAILYFCFPFTVMSQMTTGPMIDCVAPPKDRGVYQGLNVTVMNIGMAVTPVIMGIISDALGPSTAVWICVGVSFLATIVNAPLVRQEGMGPPPKRVVEELKAFDWEDETTIEAAVRGDWIPAQVLNKVKRERLNAGKKFPLLHTKTYEDEKDDLPEIRKNARVDYRFLRQRALNIAKEFNDGDDKQAICDVYNQSSSADEKETAEVSREIGQWAADYLMANGYKPHQNTTIIKQMLMSAFPTITEEDEYTPENVEEIALRYARLLYAYQDAEDNRDASVSTFMQGNAGSVAFLGAS